MIIFGTRGVTMTKQNGTFFCPRCGTQQPYRHRSVRRFFTLYFIPLIPLNQLGEYVECQQCRGTFEMTVLSHDHVAEQEKFQAGLALAVKRVLVHAMMVDGRADDAEIEIAQQVYRNITGNDLTAAEIEEETRQVREGASSIGQCVREIAPHLSDDGKALVVKAAFAIVAADGAGGEQKKALLLELAGGLGMSAEQLKAVLAELTGTE